MEEHKIRPLVYVVLAFIIGELTALVGLEKVALITFIIGIVLAVVICYGLVFVGYDIKKRKIVVIVICFVMAISGYVRFSCQASIYADYDALQYERTDSGSEETVVKVSGRVKAIIQKEFSYNVQLECDDGVVILQLENAEGLKYGATVEATGTINPMKMADNPGGYDEREYLHGEGVILKLKTTLEACRISSEKDDYSYIADSLYSLRHEALNILTMQCTEKERGLLSAIVLGERSYMDEEIKELYSSQGIAHVLTISGLHISVIGMGIYRLMRKKMRYLSSATVSAVIMLLFCLMTGNSVSAVRAVIMFVMHVVSDVLGRKYDVLSAICLSGLVLLFNNPFYITNASFILSYVAMLAVAIVAPIVAEFFAVESNFIKTLLFNISMTFSSLPVTSCMFYRIPTYAILLNMLVIPLMGVMLATAIIGMIISVISTDIGMACIGVAVYILRFYELISGLTQNMTKSSVVTGNIEFEYVVIYYVVLGVMLWIMRKDIKRRERASCHKSDKSSGVCGGVKKNWNRRAVMIIGIEIFCMLYIVYVPKKNGFELTFLDVGQGDCAYIHSDVGNDYLIDCGSTDEESVGKYKLESFLEYSDVDDVEYVFVSHCDTDHISGIVELLERGDILVENLVLPATERENVSENGEGLIALAKSREINIIYAEKGTKFTDGELEIWCISPDTAYDYADINEASMVLMMRYDGMQVLFAGDIGTETEQRLLTDIEEFMKETNAISDKGVTTIYKVAHHGSKNSSGEELLELLRPDIAIISCGEDNSYGHPHEETMKRLEANGALIFTTPESGAIMFEVNEEVIVRQWGTNINNLLTENE